MELVERDRNERERLERERIERERVEQERVDQELLFRRLKPVETGYHRKLRCMDGTRQSLLNQVTDWVANNSGQENVLQRNAYWFYGSPGIGKTSLAHSICASLHERNQLAGAFFCRRDDPNLSEPINILPTFIHELATHFPPFWTIVANYLRDDPKLTPESMKTSIFLDFIRSLPNHPEHALVFVIDALDECGDAQSRPRLLKVLTKAAAQAPWLKIIVTSRTEVDIQHFFDTLTHSSYIPYDLATDQDASADLRAFARTQFDLVAERWHLDTPWPEESDFNKVISRSKKVCDSLYSILCVCVGHLQLMPPLLESPLTDAIRQGWEEVQEQEGRQEEEKRRHNQKEKGQAGPSHQCQQRQGQQRQGQGQKVLKEAFVEGQQEKGWQEVGATFGLLFQMDSALGLVSVYGPLNFTVEYGLDWDLLTIDCHSSVCTSSPPLY